MKLWHCRDARSFRPLWAMEEMGLPYALEIMPFPPRVHHRQYLAINPLGTVPYFVDGDTDMTESVAICHYLAVRHGRDDLLVAPAEADFGAWLNWLYHADATLTFPQAIYLRYSKLEPEPRRQPGVAEDYRRWYLARLRLLDAHLLEHEHLCAGRFTIADIAIGYALYLGRCLGLAQDYQPQTQAWLSRLMQREGFQRALQAQGRDDTGAG